MRREDGDVARLSGSLFQKYETTSVVEVSSTPTLLHVVENQMENAQPGEVHRCPKVVVADSTLFLDFQVPIGPFEFNRAVSVNSENISGNRISIDNWEISPLNCPSPSIPGIKLSSKVGVGS